MHISVRSRTEMSALLSSSKVYHHVLAACGTASRATHITPWCTVRDGEDVTLTFESFVTKSDLKRALRQHEALASVLGVNLSSDKELDALFDKYNLDSDHDSAIMRGEWQAFVKRLHAAAMAQKQAHKRTRAIACTL